MKIYENISEVTGKTPLVKLNKIVSENDATILAKLEFYNPTSSVKDRIAVEMINVAEKNGFLKKGGTIVESTSGNTGLGLAMVAASRGYKLIITMPETMSVERRSLMSHLGGEIILTDGTKGMKGAIDKANEIIQENPDFFMPQQFDNEANPAAHYKNTGNEIWDDTDGKIDIFIAGVGTGGTISGTAKLLKEKNPDIKVIAVEPSKSPVLSGGQPGPHGIQGIGAGFIPSILNKGIIDEVIKVRDTNAVQAAKNVAKKEGVLCGISSGAAISAAIEIAKRAENTGKNIVVILPDTGERYLSTALFA